MRWHTGQQRRPRRPWRWLHMFVCVLCVGCENAPSDIRVGEQTRVGDHFTWVERADGEGLCYLLAGYLTTVTRVDGAVLHIRHTPLDAGFSSSPDDQVCRRNAVVIMGAARWRAWRAQEQRNQERTQKDDVYRTHVGTGMIVSQEGISAWAEVTGTGVPSMSPPP